MLDIHIPFIHFCPTFHKAGTVGANILVTKVRFLIEYGK
jgi:hypothetical protein